MAIRLAPKPSEPITNRITNTPKVKDAKEAVYRWRKSNPEAYRAYMRDYMRKRRAKG